jgi:hypothetical protein
MPVFTRFEWEIMGKAIGEIHMKTIVSHKEWILWHSSLLYPDRARLER